MEPRPPARTTTPTTDDATAAPVPEAAPRLSGVHIFLNAKDAARANGNGHAPAAPNGTAPRPAASRRLLVSLLLADALLCVLAWFVVARGGSVGWLGWTLVVLAVGVGAWLSLLAFTTLGAERTDTGAKKDRLNGGD